MRDALNESDLNQMALGSKVEDSDGDTWEKNSDGTWTLSNIGGTFVSWSAYRLLDQYSVYLPEVEEPKQEMTQVTSDILRPQSEYVAEERTALRLEVLEAQGVWLSEGYDDDVFIKGLNLGWFTDKFFRDLAEGDAF